LKSVTSIEHVGSHFGRLYRAMTPRWQTRNSLVADPSLSKYIGPTDCY
jgi:hypothetical protein